MISDIAALVGISVTAIGGVIWAVRLEGKVLAHEVLDNNREKALGERHDELKTSLVRIEGKIDTVALAASETAKTAAVAIALLQKRA